VVCGPSVDPELIRIAAYLDAIRKHGFDVQRYNLSQDIQAFTIKLPMKYVPTDLHHRYIFFTGKGGKEYFIVYVIKRNKHFGI